MNVLLFVAELAASLLIGMTCTDVCDVGLPDDHYPLPLGVDPQ